MKYEDIDFDSKRIKTRSVPITMPEPFWECLQCMDDWAAETRAADNEATINFEEDLSTYAALLGAATSMVLTLRHASMTEEQRMDFLDRIGDAANCVVKAKRELNAINLAMMAVVASNL